MGYELTVWHPMGLQLKILCSGQGLDAAASQTSGGIADAERADRAEKSACTFQVQKSQLDCWQVDSNVRLSFTGGI